MRRKLQLLWQGALTSQNIKRTILVIDDLPDIAITLKIGLEEAPGPISVKMSKTIKTTKT
jgi:type III secretory pathway component EscU